MKRVLRFLLIGLGVASILGGCGNGGGSAAGGSAPTTLQVTPSDGYLNGATVCLDLNLNGACDGAEEPTTKESEGNIYTLVLSEAHTAHKNFDIAPIVVYGGRDIDTGKPFEGKLESMITKSEVANGVTHVSPITTLVSKIATKSINNNIDTRKAIKDAEDQVKAALGIPVGIEVDADPIMLQEGGDDSLIKVSLSLQKSIQTMAKAASSEVGAKSERDSVEDIFEALADSIEVGNKGGINAVMQKAVEMENEKPEEDRKIPPRAAAALEVAKDIAKKIEEIFDLLEELGKNSDAIKQVASIIESDLGKIEDELENFDGDGNFSTNIDLNVSENDAMFQDGYDFGAEALKEAILTLPNFSSGISEMDSLVSALAKLGITAQNLFSQESLEILEDNADENNSPYYFFLSLYGDIEKEIARWAHEEREEQAKSTSGSKIELPMTLHDIFQEDNGKIGASAVTLKSDKTIVIKEYELLSGVWSEVDFSADITLQESEEWDKGLALSFTVNSNGSIYLPVWGERVWLSENINIGGESTLIPALDIAVKMPAGSTMQTLKIKQIRDEVSLWERVTHWETGVAYTSFKELIENQCAISWVAGNSNSGLAFGSYEQDDNGSYLCNENATQGTLYEAGHNGIISKNAGSWKIEKIGAKKISILKFTPKNIKKYAWDENDKIAEYPIFAMYDGVVYRGQMEPEGVISSFITYNETAIDAIKKRLANMQAVR